MRSFIALSLRPEKPARDLVVSLSSMKGAKTVKNAEIHLTLSFLGDISEEQKDEFCRILRGIEFPAFTLRTGSVGAFPRPEKARVAFIGVNGDEVVKLQKLLMSRIPEEFREKREFVPHLTLSRFKVPADIRKVQEQYRNAAFGDYRMEKLTLYKSDLTPAGAVYTEICSVQLI